MKIKIEGKEINGAFFKDLKKSVSFPCEMEVSNERYEELKSNPKLKVSKIEASKKETKKIK